ncbi:MAG: tRNA (adenosine(37)-N6)-threonylcarbamoyltransferase complex ATPase subunit type 1 TsaE [Clostridiales Family XIII bacterium]|nr:tRNA (adenosine(37)-N6)-threonylcarbamoyltransferase complex ATPase subunit type 1 TsaE [Clostridiales Family XIII bacterium]
MQKKIRIKNENELERIAKMILQLKKKNESLIVLLFGDLGVGKTTLTKKLAYCMNINEEIISPTFSILNEYHNSSCSLFHFDLYRLNSYNDFIESFDINEYLNKKAIVVIEWPEKILDILPPEKIIIKLEYGANEDERLVYFFPKNSDKCI